MKKETNILSSLILMIFVVIAFILIILAYPTITVYIAILGSSFFIFYSLFLFIQKVQDVIKLHKDFKTTWPKAIKYIFF